MKRPLVEVYVAGPFSASDASTVQQNVRRAQEAGLQLARLGVMPIVPHTAHGGHVLLEHVQPYDFWIEATEDLLLRCDAILLLPAYDLSNGARREKMRALQESMPVFGGTSSLLEGLYEVRKWLATVNDKQLAHARLERLARALGVVVGKCSDTDAPIPYRLPSELPRPSQSPNVRNADLDSYCLAIGGMPISNAPRVPTGLEHDPGESDET